MRNLKRALSLALASVMLMGMMVVGSSAVSYPDVDTADNLEAIEVLKAVGIMTGDEKGNFNPDALVTRNEMAVVMCNLLDYTVASYKGTAPFSDVPAWAEPYVAACYTNGIIAGYSATAFGGSDSVTTGQGALMLMKALGYFQYQNDFGEDWLVATTGQGAKIDLFDGIDTGAREPMTRNDVAKMVLNALEADMVDATGGGVVVEGNGITVNTGKATYNARTSSSNKYGKIDDERSTNSGRYIVQMGEDLFGGDLEKLSRRDSFGRPGTRWNYKGDQVGTYANGADNSMVITKSQNAQQVLVTDNDGFNYNTGDLASNLTVYINGDQVSTAVSYASLTNASLEAGDQVELFENDDNKIETISVIRYSLAKITDVEDSLSSTYTNRGASVAIDLEDLNEASVGAGTYYDKYTGDAARELNGYAESTYTEDTVLAVALRGSDNAILSSHVASDAAGVVTSYNTGAKANITLDGTQYYLHQVLTTSSASSIAKNALTFNFNDSTYTAYLDANGYVMGIDESESVKIEDVYYVAGVFEDTNRGTSYYAQAVSLADGTLTEFKVNATETHFDMDSPIHTTDLSGSTFTAGYLAVGSLYTFEKSGGNFDAVPYVTNSDSTYYIYATGGLLSGTNVATAGAIGDDLARNDTRMSIGGARLYLNNSTNYIKVEGSSNDIDVSFVTGGTSAKQNNSGAATTAIAVATRSNNNYVANYVILVSTNFSNAGSEDVVFVHEPSNTTVSYRDKDGDSQTGWSTELYFLNGSGNVETVTVVGRVDAGFYTYEINDDGVYELEANTQTLNGQFASIAGNVSYDDETGYLGYTKGGNNDAAANGDDLDATAGHALTGIYNNALSAVNITANGHNVDMSDVDFASNVIIRDDRGGSARDADVYTSQITTVSQLKTAIDRSAANGGVVKAVLYYDNGEVVMVYVLEVANAGGVTPPTPDTGYMVETAPTVTATTAGVSVANTVIHYNGSAPDSAVAGLTMTVRIEDRASGAWNEYDTVTVANTINTSGNLTATAASCGLTAGTAYRITITLTGGNVGTLELYSGIVTATTP